MINIQNIADCLSVKTDTIVTVLFSFIIFTAGVLVRIVFRLIQRYCERKRIRAYFKIIIENIAEDAKKQIEPFDRIITSLQMKNHEMIYFTSVSANSLNLFEKLSFDKLYDAFFSGIVFNRKKRRDAFNQLQNKSELIRQINNKLSTDITELENKFHIYEQGWNKEIDRIREFFDNIRQQHFSGSIDPKLTGFVLNLNEIFYEWAKQDDRANRTIVKAFIIDHLDSDFYRQFKEHKEAMVLQNYSISALMFYKNMENIYNSYSDLFAQYRSDYLDYQISVPSLIGKLNNNFSR